MENIDVIIQPSMILANVANWWIVDLEGDSKIV